MLADSDATVGDTDIYRHLKLKPSVRGNHQSILVEIDTDSNLVSNEPKCVGIWIDFLNTQQHHNQKLSATAFRMLFGHANVDTILFAIPLQPAR